MQLHSRLSENLFKVLPKILRNRRFQSENHTSPLKTVHTDSQKEGKIYERFFPQTFPERYHIFMIFRRIPVTFTSDFQNQEIQIFSNILSLNFIKEILPNYMHVRVQGKTNDRANSPNSLLTRYYRNARSRTKIRPRRQRGLQSQPSN